MENSIKKHTEMSDADLPAKQSQTSSDPLKSDQTKESAQSAQQTPVHKASVQQEKGGFENSQDPTRYGDWEIAGRCVDF